MANLVIVIVLFATVLCGIIITKRRRAQEKSPVNPKERCPICGSKMKKSKSIEPMGMECKNCNVEPDEQFLADCLGERYAKTDFESAHVNVVLTNRRLLAFFVYDANQTTEKVYNEGLNFFSSLSSIVSVETKDMLTIVNVNVPNVEPLRVMLESSYDGSITGDEFRVMLVSAIKAMR